MAGWWALLATRTKPSMFGIFSLVPALFLGYIFSELMFSSVIFFFAFFLFFSVAREQTSLLTHSREKTRKAVLSVLVLITNILLWAHQYIYLYGVNYFSSSSNERNDFFFENLGYRSSLPCLLFYACVAFGKVAVICCFCFSVITYMPRIVVRYENFQNHFFLSE